MTFRDAHTRARLAGFAAGRMGATVGARAGRDAWFRWQRVLIRCVAGTDVSRCHPRRVF